MPLPGKCGPFNLIDKFGDAHSDHGYSGFIGFRK